MKDLILTILSGLTGPQLAFLCLLLGIVFSCGFAFGAMIIASILPRRRPRGLYIAPHRTFWG